MQKARKLAESGAVLRIVAPEICNEIIQEFSIGNEIRGKTYDIADLDGCYIVVAATDNEALNSQISKDCRKLGIMVNAVDQPEDCDFIVPAVVDKGGIRIAICTGGASPALAGWIKRQIDKALSPRLPEGLQMISKARAELIEKQPGEFDHRAKAFRAFFDSDLWLEFLDGSRDLTSEVIVGWILSYSE